jgi:hypothetical protein
MSSGLQVFDLASFLTSSFTVTKIMIKSLDDGKICISCLLVRAEFELSFPRITRAHDFLKVPRAHKLSTI